jgi:hypothetical protein
MGANYLLLEEYEKSFEYLEKYIDGINGSGIKPDFPWLWIGSAYWKNGNLEMAGGE